MMTTFKKISTFFAGLVLFFGCTKPQDVELPAQPNGYLELLEIYNEEIPFLKAEFVNTSTVVLSFEGRTLTLTQPAVRIHDHKSAPVPAISVSAANNMWLIDGLLSGVKHYPQLSDQMCCPVYVWVDKHTLHMLIANGHQLDYNFIDNGPGEPRIFTVPVITLKTTGGVDITSKEEYLTGTISISDPDGTYGEKSYEGTMRIKGRGNSTWGNPKKPYRIKLDQKASLLGMPEEKDWVLLANYSDKSLLRNKTAFKLSEICGMSWTPRMESAEVYLNGQYIGLYNLCEQKEVATHKVNIKVVKETDNEGEALTGDYYFEMEQNMDETTCWWTWKGVPMMFIEPEIPTGTQLEYIKSYFYQFEVALFGENFKSETEGYAKYIDVDSFINYYIIQELSKNVDGNTRKSTFLTKKKGEKLEMYHVWDFDLAFGNADYFEGAVGNGPENWWIKSYGCQGYHTGWYWRLFQDPAFVNKVKSRWAELKPELELIPDFIDFWAAELQDAPARNFQKWRILNIYVWPNVKIPGTYQGEVDYLKEFYTARLNWIDENLAKL